MSTTRKGLLERFSDGEVVITAEGYLIEMEKRGYNRNGGFIPVAVLDHPDRVEDLTREFIHAGSDVASAFVYFASRNKLRDEGCEGQYEVFNRQAYEIAKKVSSDTGALFSAGISKVGLYNPDDAQSFELCEQAYREQIGMGAEYGVDLINIQTIWDYGEAAIALKVSKEFNIPAVVTMAPIGKEKIPTTFDGYEMKDALQKLLDEGAACVGLNCARGPQTMIPIMRHLKQEIKGPLACLANGIRTTEQCQTWYQLTHPETGKPCFPDDIGTHCLGGSDAKWYSEQMAELGIQFVGLCCGNTASYTRTLAMGLGRSPPAAKYASQYDTTKSLTRGKGGFSADRYGAYFCSFTGKVGSQQQ